MQPEKHRNSKSDFMTFFLLAVIVFVTVAASSKVASSGKSTETLSYVQNSNNPAQTLDLTVPTANMPGTLSNPPLVIFVHGGAWVEGDKSQNAAISLVDHGFAVASINYRFSSEAKFPAQIDDCRAALKFLRDNAEKYHFNKDRIGLFGNSAGGHLVCLLGLTDRVQAVCDWNGVTDFKTVLKQRVQTDEIDKLVIQLLGGLPDDVPDAAAKASPITFVSKDAPPFLIIHGNADDVVPFAQSTELYDALKKSGTDVQLVTIEKGSHNLFTPENLATTTKFFEEKLKH